MSNQDLDLFFGRKKEFVRLQDFLQQQGSGFTHVRGRRRIGKSEFLLKVAKETANSLYFYGADDESGKETLQRFIKLWEQFAGEKTLSRYKESEVNWEDVFLSIEQFALKQKNTLLLIFDEIQWIAKQGSGFAGILKSVWLKLKKTKKIKIILCGSSNKFFLNKANSPTAILRGLRTYPEIWIQPFTLKEVKKYYFPKWTEEQVCLVYMMLGGIPYYLEQIKVSDNFIRSINQSVFTQSGIFLNEVHDLLNLEFSDQSHKNVFNILSFLTQSGSTQANLIKKTGLGESTVRYILNKLIDYEIVFTKTSYGKKQSNSAGIKYYMRDFYLNFYFQVLIKLESRIANNTNALLFACECLQSNSGYYIPDFTGKAFELLVAEVLNSRHNLEPKIFKKLNIIDSNYNVATYWNKDIEIDLLVDCPEDREIRLLEMKWINSKKHQFDSYLKKISNLSLKFLPKEYLVSRYVISSNTSAVKDDGVVELLTLKDLF